MVLPFFRELPWTEMKGTVIDVLNDMLVDRKAFKNTQAAGNIVAKQHTSAAI